MAKQLKDMTDEELADALSQAESAGKLKQEEKKPVQPKLLSEMSDEELQAALEASDREKPGVLRDLGNKALEGIQYVGEKVDSVTGAPTRAAIGALQDGQGLSGAASAFKEQFAEDPSIAPTGKMIAQKAGISDNPLITDENLPFVPISAMPMAYVAKKMGVTRSGAAGLAIDAAADPTNIIPGVGLAKEGVLGTKALVKTGAELGLEGVKTVAKAAAKGAAEVAPKATAAIEGGVDSLKNAAAFLSKSVKPEIRPQYAKDVELALKNNIDPELLSATHKYGQESFIANARKAQELDVAGEPLLKKREAGVNAVREAVDNNIAKIGNGTVLDPISAGEKVKEAYQSEVKKFFDSMDVTYDRITDKDVASGLMVNKDEMAKIDSKLNGLEKWAKGRAQRGITATQREQGKQILNAVDAIRSGNGSFKQTKEALRDIGEVAYGAKHSGGDIPPDVEKFRELYSTVREGLINTVDKDVSKDMARELVENNKAMTDFFRENEKISKVLTDPNAPGEKIFKDLIESGNSQKIRALKNIVKDPEALGQVKAAYLEHLKNLNRDGLFSFESYHSTLQNNPSATRVVKELFDAGELDNIRDLIKLGVDFGPPLNPSGTARTTSFMNLRETAGRAAVNSGLIEYMERAAAQRATGNAAALPEDIARAVSAAPSSPAVPAPRGIGDILEQLKPGKENLRVINPMNQTNMDIAAKGARLYSSQNERSTQEEDVPMAMRAEARQRIMRAPGLTTIQKAEALDRLNRRGKLDLGLLDHLKPQKSQDRSAPAGQNSGSTRNVTDFVGDKKVQEY